MRVMGIDPGSRATGFGIVDVAGQQLTTVAQGTVQCPRGEAAERLGQICQRIGALIAQHRPDVMAIERVFVGRNTASALMLGQARGAVLAGAGMAGLPVVEYSTAQVKQAVVGTGRASKEQVRHMVGILLDMDTAGESLDMTDALALAICHAHSRGLSARAGLPAGARFSRRASRRGGRR